MLMNYNVEDQLIYVHADTKPDLGQLSRQYSDTFESKGYPHPPLKSTRIYIDLVGVNI